MPVALQAEIICTILANGIAFTKGWFRLWLECDSQLAIQLSEPLKTQPLFQGDCIIDGLIAWRRQNK